MNSGVIGTIYPHDKCLHNYRHQHHVTLIFSVAFFMLTDSRGCLRHGVTLWYREYCMYNPCKNIILPIKLLEVHARDFVQYRYFKLKVVSFYEVSVFGK